MTAGPPPRLVTPLRPAPAPSATWARRWFGRLLAGYLALRTLVLLAVCLAGFIVVTSIAGAWIESSLWRLIVGAVVVLGAPLLLLWRLQRVISRRGDRLRLGRAWTLVCWNVALVAVLGLGFSDAVGRAVRRRADWFLGSTDGWLPRRYRRGIAAAGLWMERFDLPPEARPLLAEAATPQIEPRPVAHEPAQPELSPPLWHYPLPTRVVPPHAACRFGAPRRGRHPPECELGHCGVDLEQPRGTPVYAVYDGVVQRVVRDEATGGSSGRQVTLTHKEGQLTTSYLHLHAIRSDLRVGATVKGGEAIGTVGSTGAALGPHLHFELAVRQGVSVSRIDPEPLIRHWRLRGEGAANASLMDPAQISDGATRARDVPPLCASLPRVLDRHAGTTRGRDGRAPLCGE
jgi:hypothetical protein